VIFCEPIWQADIETQAIKVGRGQRIQHHTHSANLASSILKGRSGKLPGVIQEAGMRHFIEVFFCHAEALSTLINYEYTEPCISF